MFNIYIVSLAKAKYTLLNSDMFIDAAMGVAFTWKWHKNINNPAFVNIAYNKIYLIFYNLHLN